MKKHKVLLLLFSFVALMAFVFAGCKYSNANGNGNKDGGSNLESLEIEYTLTLDRTSLLMTLGDENTPLNASYDYQDGATLSFTSFLLTTPTIT